MPWRTQRSFQTAAIRSLLFLTPLTLCSGTDFCPDLDLGYAFTISEQAQLTGIEVLRQIGTPFADWLNPNVR